MGGRRRQSSTEKEPGHGRTLSPKAMAFAHEYGGPGDGAAAAVRAGYAAVGAKVTASRLLSDPRVQAIVRERGVGEREVVRQVRGGLDTSSPEAFFRGIAADDTIPLMARQRAMERLEQIQRRSGDAERTTIDGYRAELREALDAARRARIARRRTAEGLGMELRELQQDADAAHAEILARCIDSILEAS